MTSSSGQDAQPQDIPPLEHRAMARLAPGVRRLLSRRIECALEHQSGARANLRDAVRQIALDMRASGASSDHVRTLLTRAVEGHPRRAALDRVAIIADQPTSDVLSALIVDWLEGTRPPRMPWPSEGPTLTRRTSPAGAHRVVSEEER